MSRAPSNTSGESFQWPALTSRTARPHTFSFWLVTVRISMESLPRSGASCAGSKSPWQSITRRWRARRPWRRCASNWRPWRLVRRTENSKLKTRNSRFKTVLLVIDNYDSFTYNLVQYLGELGETIEVRRNDQVRIEEIDLHLRPSRIVISPGPGKPEDAGLSMKIIERFAGKIPILGVCLGHQAIARV